MIILNLRTSEADPERNLGPSPPSRDGLPNGGVKGLNSLNHCTIVGYVASAGNRQ